MPEMSLDEVRTELAEIDRKLGEIPDDAFAERVGLRERWLELMALAAELREASRTPDELRKELQDLRRVRDEIHERHLSIGNIGAGGGPGGGGIDIEFVTEMNRTIDEAWDLAKVERRIRQLEAQLAGLDT
jgi:hypothetical protein